MSLVQSFIWLTNTFQKGYMLKKFRAVRQFNKC